MIFSSPISCFLSGVDFEGWYLLSLNVLKKFYFSFMVIIYVLGEYEDHLCLSYSFYADVV